MHRRGYGPCDCFTPERWPGKEKVDGAAGPEYG